jgi:hypothetical protein
MDPVPDGAPASRQEFPLRLEAGAASRVARLAACELRSANAQIEMLLRCRLARNPEPAPVAPPERGAARKAIALRLPAALLDQLRSSALAQGVSCNARIEALIMQELAARGA